MPDPELHLDDLPMATLLRAARRTYGTAIRAALEHAGYDDVPGNGLFVISAVANTGAQLSELIEWLGTSKQAAGQLVDTLVVRGYLGREVDSKDRRRLIITPTEQGRRAAAVIRTAAVAVDHALLERVGADRVADARATLVALIAIADADA
jgi:DNA-binding MarR family transcriptional regulator